MSHDATDTAPPSTGERFLDAALSEHARLGNGGCDDELVLRILRETVHRPAAANRSARRRLDRKSLALGFGAVAATVAAALLLLSSLPIETATRRSDELRFVVHLEDAGTFSGPAAAAPRQAASRHTGPLAFTAPEAGGAETAPAPRAWVDFELATEFGPSFADFPARGVRHEDLRISAARSHRSEEVLTYEGKVVVEHSGFRIEAARITIPSSGSTEVPLLAHTVRVEHAATGCVAEGKSLTYDPVSGNLLLTGVNRVVTREGEMSRFAAGDRLLLSESSFSVERGPVEIHASPLPKPRP